MQRYAHSWVNSASAAVAVTAEAMTECIMELHDHDLAICARLTALHRAGLASASASSGGSSCVAYFSGG
jgi:hypothetical protein